MTDPIADLLTRIRNAYAAHHDDLNAPHSKMKAELAKVLADHGYLASAEVIENDGRKVIHMTLKYEGRQPVISTIERISSPGRRIYSAAKAVKSVLSGHGVRIISTNKGIMVDTDARRQNLGGEVICKVW